MANWTGGSMGAYLHGYPEIFGERPVRDVGLIASEGRMTIPIEDGTPAGVLDIRHHYFEFIPEDQDDRDDPETVEASELIEGRNYFILLTTAGGLYRYRIHDLVRCVGFHGRAPLLEFLNKGAHFSSLTGEKLSEFQVLAAVSQATKALDLHLGSFLVVPTWGDPPFYTMLVEESDLAEGAGTDRLAAEVELQPDAQQPRIRKQAHNPSTRPNPIAPHRCGVMDPIPASTPGAEWGNRRTVYAAAPGSRPDDDRFVSVRRRGPYRQRRLKDARSRRAVATERVPVASVRVALDAGIWYRNPLARQSTEPQPRGGRAAGADLRGCGRIRSV